MAYTSNPYAAKARREAVNLVLKQSLSPAAAARKTGVHRSTIGRWLKKCEELELWPTAYVPTLSSVAHTHTNGLSPEVVTAIIRVRRKHNRCAYVVWRQLQREGVTVSLSSVERTIKRAGLTRRVSQRRRLHPGVRRPIAAGPGDLVQVDTVHFLDFRTGKDRKRFYIYTLIDLYSRWAYAEYSPKLRPDVSVAFVLRAQVAFGRPFRMVQTDNGPEFSKHFGDKLATNSIALRHSRVRQSNDTAHIERFNRTLQDECLSRYPIPELAQERLTPFLAYYNTARLHISIDCATPNEMLQRR
jgi:transposase InsO family protein